MVAIVLVLCSNCYTVPAGSSCQEVPGRNTTPTYTWYMYTYGGLAQRPAERGCTMMDECLAGGLFFASRTFVLRAGGRRSGRAPSPTGFAHSG
ncbi:hypothetical protein PR003_g32444 [Phytophthora rubi]|uniref:Secreted protein n=1 Tax=Phytophthora rubi TaxID=129364 RepID=A0A6A3I727_9STRA|nr:hypothetical protein PR002_g24971 [Phytophthora rubi]KAE9265484.1 hypothetical protein PR003_g32444 [Phytophthora rubi]